MNRVRNWTVHGVHSVCDTLLVNYLRLNRPHLTPKRTVIMKTLLAILSVIYLFLKKKKKKENNKRICFSFSRGNMFFFVIFFSLGEIW